MTHKAAIAAAIFAMAGTPVFAQVTGGELGIEYNAPVDGSDFGGTTYSGGIEYGFGRNFSIALNVSGYKLDNIDTTAANATLHAIYHLNDIASIGVFSASDGVDDQGNNMLGIEGGTEFMGGDIGAYIGRLEGREIFTTLGAEGQYAIGARGFSVISELDVLTNDDLSSSQFAIGAQYEISGGPEFYAKVGTTRYEDLNRDDTSTFVGIGAKVSFGASRGTTFGTRSAFDSLPRF